MSFPRGPGTRSFARVGPSRGENGPVLAVGWQAIVTGRAGAASSVVLTDDDGTTPLGTLAAGLEVEILAWRPYGANGTRYRVLSRKGGIEGWIGAASLTASRPLPPPKRPAPAAPPARRTPAGPPARRTSVGPHPVAVAAPSARRTSVGPHSVAVAAPSARRTSVGPHPVAMVAPRPAAAPAAGRRVPVKAAKAVKPPASGATRKR